MEVKLITLLGEYGPLGVSLALVAIIWFKTSKQHTEIITVLTRSHNEGMNRVAGAVEKMSVEVGETNRLTAEIRGMMRIRRVDDPSGAHIDD